MLEENSSGGEGAHGFLGCHAGGARKGGDPEEAVCEEALIRHIRERPVEAYPHRQRDQRGQAARQGVNLRILVQLGNLHLGTRNTAIRSLLLATAA